MNYSQLLSKALEITKKHRYLWWLTLITLLGGVAIEENTSYNFNFSIPDFPTDTLQTSDLKEMFTDIFREMSDYLPIILGIIIFLLLLRIFFYIAGLIAKGGLTDSILKIDSKKHSSFSDAISNGTQYAFRIFLVRLIFGIISVIIFIVSIPILIALFFLFFITIPLLWLVYLAISILLKNSQILIVSKNMSTIQSIKTSWQLLIKEWKSILILWLIRFAIETGLGIIFLLIILLILIPIIILGILLVVAKQFILLTIIIAIILLVFFVITLFISSIINTYFNTYWTLGIHSISK